MSAPWYVAEAHARGRLIAAFLTAEGVDENHPLRVGSIAELTRCPIRPPNEGRDYGSHASHVVGGEPHCRRVAAALRVAVRLGLVSMTRKGKGPWRYHAASEVKCSGVAP